MTTGIKLFMIRSGRNWPSPEIPMPDLAVPYAAPTAARSKNDIRQKGVSTMGLEVAKEG